MAAHLRVGSVVRIDGSSVDQTVTDITDAYLEVEQLSGTETVAIAWTWSAITTVRVVTD